MKKILLVIATALLAVNVWGQTTENVVIGIWEELEPVINALGIHLHRVKVEETENNFVEYFGN